MPTSYYFTAGTYQATWSTANTTTKFNDGSVGDTTTFETSNTGTTAKITGFADLGASLATSAHQFTFFASAIFAADNWIVEGSNDHSSWSTIASGTYSTGQNTITVGASATAYQYYRVSIDGSNSGTLQIQLSDWRITAVASGSLLNWIEVL